MIQRKIISLCWCRAESASEASLVKAKHFPNYPRDNGLITLIKRVLTPWIWVLCCPQIIQNPGIRPISPVEPTHTDTPMWFQDSLPPLCNLKISFFA